MTLVDLSFRPDQIRSLYLIHLQQMYSAEEQFMAAIPTVAISIANLDIRQILLSEAANTPDHLTVFDEFYSELGEKPTGPLCLPVKALVDQSHKLILQHPFGPGRDLLLSAIALEMKHLNIAKYMMAATFARALNLTRQQMVSSRILREEEEVERKLRFALQEIPNVLKAMNAATTEVEVAVISEPQVP